MSTVKQKKKTKEATASKGENKSCGTLESLDSSKKTTFKLSEENKEDLIGREDQNDNDSKVLQNYMSCKSLNTEDYSSSRQRTSNLFNIPSQFFQSRESIRTWGANKLTDPAVQPLPQDGVVPHPFHVTLPGYYEFQCENLIKNEEKKELRDAALGPDLSSPPLTWIPVLSPDPYFKEQKIGYDWSNQKSFKMNKLPYRNALFEPKDPQETNMYKQMFPCCAYPYGVPAVDEYVDYCC